MSITIAIFLFVSSNLVLASENRHDIGYSFYIPDTDMLDALSGGSQIFQSSVGKCIKEVADAKIKRSFLFYGDQKSFYHSLRTEVGIGGQLMSAFTMGATLNSVSGSSSLSDTIIKGATLDIASYSRQKYIDMSCIYESELAQNVTNAFEQLSATIDRPEQKNSWFEYDIFFISRYVRSDCSIRVIIKLFRRCIVCHHSYVYIFCRYACNKKASRSFV